MCNLEIAVPPTRHLHYGRVTGVHDGASLAGNDSCEASSIESMFSIDGEAALVAWKNRQQQRGILARRERMGLAFRQVDQFAGSELLHMLMPRVGDVPLQALHGDVAAGWMGRNFVSLANHQPHDLQLFVLQQRGSGRRVERPRMERRSKRPDVDHHARSFICDFHCFTLL